MKKAQADLRDQWGWKETPVPEKNQDESGKDYRTRRMAHFMKERVFRAMLLKSPGQRDPEVLETAEKEMTALAEYLDSLAPQEQTEFVFEFLERIRHRKFGTGLPYFQSMDRLPSGMKCITLGVTVPRHNPALEDLAGAIGSDPEWFDRLRYYPETSEKEIRARMKFGYLCIRPGHEFGPSWRERHVGVKDTDWLAPAGGGYLVFRWSSPKNVSEHRPVKYFKNKADLDAWLEAGAPVKAPCRRKQAYAAPDRTRIRSGAQNTYKVNEEDFFEALRIPNAESYFKKKFPRYARQWHEDIMWDSVHDLMSVTGLGPEDFTFGGFMQVRCARPGRKTLAAFDGTTSDSDGRAGEMMLRIGETFEGASVAHEWWHAVQFAASCRPGSENCGIKALEEAAETAPELQEYRARARLADAGREKYYAQTKEMLARLFEGFVFYELEKQGIVNRHLLSPLGLAEFTGGKCTGVMPEEEEVAFTAPLFREFFDGLIRHGILTEKKPVYYATESGQMSFFGN